jgi:cysteine desulfurase / selenocysteine lyase
MNAPAPRPRAAPAMRFDVERIRSDFPILANVQVHGKPLVYLDNAASSQMPQPVIDRWLRYQTAEHANIHRGVYYLSELATAEYDAAKRRVQKFINAASEREIIVTSGTTDSINLVANAYGRKFFREGDEIILSQLEHHANIVPWQMVAEERGARIRVIPCSDAGELDIEAYEKLFSDRTKFIAITHVSNALGSVSPVKEMVAIAHRHGVPVLVDGAQAVPHMRVDVQDLGADFYAFSGHKMCGPTGVGILYGRLALLEKLPPYRGGGDMIRSVTFEKTTYADVPARFEAGTPPIAAAITLGAAVDYLESIGMDRIAAYEHELLEYGMEVVSSIPGLRVIGTAPNKAGVLSMVLDDVHPHDIGTLLNHDGVAIRTGHHCAQPVMQRFGVPATARASFAFYNTFAEIDALAASLRRIQKLFA